MFARKTVDDVFFFLPPRAPRPLPLITSSVTHSSMAVSLLPRNCWCFTWAMPFRMNVHTPCAAPFPQVRADGGQACARYPGRVGVSFEWVSWIAITSGRAVGSNDLRCCWRTALRHRNPLAFQCQILSLLLLSIMWEDLLCVAVSLYRSVNEQLQFLRAQGPL